MSTDTSHDEESPWTTRRFVTAAVVVALIVLMGVGVVVSNMRGGKSDPAPSSAPSVSSPAPSASVSTGGAETSMCGLPGYATTGTVTRPPEAQWSLVGTIAAPSSKSSGPGRVDADGYRACYAHTPEGALIAAANFLAMSSQRDIAVKVATNSVAKGPGRDVAMRATPQAGGGTRIQTVGFRVLTYTGSTATVDIAFRTSNGALAAIVWELVWEEGDWKFRLTPAGELPSQPSQIRDLSGYVLWSGA